MTRRGFLARLFAAPVVALAVLRAPVVVQPVEGWDVPPTGIAMRFVQNFDIESDRMPHRFDVLYGFGDLTSTSATRVQA